MEKITYKDWLSKDLADFEPIRQRADALRKEHFGEEVYIRGLIEFSNYCGCSCAYCGLRAQNKKLKRFRLSYEEIFNIIEESYDAGYRSFVLQSGEDKTYKVQGIGELVKRAKTLGDIAITLSIGERSYEEYAYLKEQGVDRFLLKHECADEVIYNKLHPHSSFKERVRCLRDLKQLGYQTGSGFMIGLPEQTLEIIEKDLILLQEIGVHMAGIGPFIPHEETPLGDTLHDQEEMQRKAELTLKAVALARVSMPHSMLPVTTSLGVIDKSMKYKCLQYGANVLMQKLESPKWRKLYELYPKEVIEGLGIKEEKELLIEELKQVGRKAAFVRGDYK